MKDQLITYLKAQGFFILVALFITHRLMINLTSLEDINLDDVRKFPGINIKEF